jgi:hypothetical protein
LAQIRVETKPWVLELPSRKLELELTTVSSNYHVELSPGDVGGTNDRYVVQEVIKDLAKNRPLDVATGEARGVAGVRPLKSVATGCGRGAREAAHGGRGLLR